MYVIIENYKTNLKKKKYIYIIKSKYWLNRGINQYNHKVIAYSCSENFQQLLELDGSFTVHVQVTWTNLPLLEDKRDMFLGLQL